jgi:RES domain-containing protein
MAQDEHKPETPAAPLSDAPFFGPAWRGWESYNEFAKAVTSELRYVRSARTKSFLTNVTASCASREVIIPSGSIYWRARLGCESEEISKIDEEENLTVVYEEDRPYSVGQMKPIPNWQGEGRANPRGIPCLYIATHRDTALAEVRPWIGATLSVAQLKTARDLKVIDCSRNHEKGSLIKVFGNSELSSDDGLWIAIDGAFAKPVSKEAESKEYIPTQIIAEVFKSSGYDGIVYKSLLSPDGFNLALFNLNDADVINCALYQANSIEFSFSEMGNQYFVVPKK